MSPAAAKAKAFLAAFAMCGSVVKSAEAAGVNRTMHRRWMRLPKYAAAFARAQQDFGDVLIAEAIRRANEGVLEPVFYQGAPCGAVRKFSDGLMWRLIDRLAPVARAPIEVTGTIAVTTPGVRALTDDELTAAIALANRLAGSGVGSE